MTTLPPSDPFWNEYLPPLGWNCRCTTVQVRKDKYPRSNSDESIARGQAATSKPKQQIFRFNPGKQQKILPPKHPYYKTANSINVKKTLTDIEKSKLQDTIELLQNSKIDFIEPKELKSNLSEEKIIERIAGGDKTNGSCSSLAFVYAGNKAGLEVYDFRGGDSCSFFSSVANISQIIKNAGGKIESSVNDFKSAKACLDSIEKGKEYYFTCACHAAIVRKKNNDEYEYLELQSDKLKGWHTFDKTALKYRFSAKQSHSFMGYKYEKKSHIIDIELLSKCSDFKDMLGYINTSESVQKKGVGGTIK